MSDRPLEGIRIADFTWVWAGPFATLQLAHLGAEVIRIETQNRVCVTRRIPPFAEGQPGVLPDRPGPPGRAGNRVDGQPPAAPRRLQPRRHHAGVRQPLAVTHPRQVSIARRARQHLKRVDPVMGRPTTR